MRRIGVIVALGALVGMLGGVVTASPALAGGRGDGWQIVPADPFTLPADFCGFDIGVSFPVNNEYSKLLKGSDGSVATLTTGSLTASFTNQVTGKSITENISGPYTVTNFGDGSAIWAFKGLTAFVLTPAQARQFGLPIVSVTAGALTASFAPGGSPDSVSLQGRVLVDICAALS
jgi:hypothetical protein